MSGEQNTVRSEHVRRTEHSEKFLVNVMRSPVIERLMVRGSQAALKHVFHDMETRTLVVELRRRAIKRWVPCGDMDRKLKIPHSAKVECGFRTTPEE